MHNAQKTLQATGFIFIINFYGLREEFLMKEFFRGKILLQVISGNG
jgi:hypothetical protein